MSEQFKLPILPDTPRSTFSQASEASASQPGLPDGRTSARSGPADIRASHSRSPAFDAERRTIAISGRNALASLGLSKRDPLGAYSRMLMGTAIWGSIERCLIWKPWATPGGRFGFRLAPSKRPTSACASGSSAGPIVWPMPRATDGEKMTSMSVARRAAGRAPDSLPEAVRMSPWPTPAIDSFRSRSGERKGEMGLDQLARRSAPWTTPSARDWRSGKASAATLNRNVRPLSEQAWNHGATLLGSTAPTASSGALNPAWVSWLMGYPTGWLD